jgi:hypothetical protein
MDYPLGMKVCKTLAGVFDLENVGNHRRSMGRRYSSPGFADLPWDVDGDNF